MNRLQKGIDSLSGSLLINTLGNDENGYDDPETHYSTLKESLEEFKSEFTSDHVFVQFIDDNLTAIDEHIEMLNELHSVDGGEELEDLIKIDKDSAVNSSLGRSIFDDVDK
ncbi:hypothetical protein [Pseudoalteromonas sp. NJ631]|uniref:hypothetical protein n=1 Tax=Pseudoalteromonas sp. NJ631 TaxID=493915 RepID=UPI000312391E|nr:hypothetical protein [Pseudoalteromonas sp. NJ631]